MFSYSCDAESDKKQHNVRLDGDHVTQQTKYSSYNLYMAVYGTYNSIKTMTPSSKFNLVNALGVQIHRGEADMFFWVLLLKLKITFKAKKVPLITALIKFTFTLDKFYIGVPTPL